MLKHLIDKVLITLEVGDRTALLILLAKDGSLHRKGNGSPDNPLELAQGYSRDGHFEALMMTIDEQIFQYAGVIRQPDPVGRECRLSIIFQGQQGADFSFRVVYGENSEGPPRELAQILINAVKITEDWYMKQLQPLPAEKKWWEVWK